jgi:hypothetical protein
MVREIYLNLRDPLHIRIEKQKQDHCQRQYVHIDAEQYTRVIDAPARPEAAQRIVGSIGSGQGGKQEEKRRAIMGKMRDYERDEKTAEDK